MFLYSLPYIDNTFSVYKNSEICRIWNTEKLIFCINSGNPFSLHDTRYYGLFSLWIRYLQHISENIPPYTKLPWQLITYVTRPYRFSTYFPPPPTRHTFHHVLVYPCDGRLCPTRGDLTSPRVFGDLVRGSGLWSPISSSVSSLPLCLLGIAEWMCYFLGRNFFMLETKLS